MPSRAIGGIALAARGHDAGDVCWDGWREAGCGRQCGVDGSCSGGSTPGRRRDIDSGQLGISDLTREAEGVCPASFLAGQTFEVVELGGFEPPTFSLRTRRATNCAIAPSAD